MLKLHVNSVPNPTATFHRAIVRYFREPDLFIGFLSDSIDSRTDRKNSTVIDAAGILGEMFRCIADKARFHVAVSYSQVANALIKRYLFLESSYLRGTK